MNKYKRNCLIISLVCFAVAAYCLFGLVSTAIASDCSDECNKSGGFYYNDCVESISKGEPPSEIILFPGEKFNAPGKGYPTQTWCLEYTQDMSKWCYDECPDEPGFLYGPYRPTYEFDDGVTPKTEKDIVHELKEENIEDCMLKCYSEWSKADGLCYKLKIESKEREQCGANAFNKKMDCINDCP